MQIDLISNLRDLSLLTITVRLMLSLVCGGLIGYDREKKGRPAGFRTHILVCLGSSLVMITSQFLIDILHYSTDPARLGAQVISGIGFLGAGTILITQKQHVKGLTTAAGLWACACMGLAIGIGFYEGALLGCLLIWSSMKLLFGFDSMLIQKSEIHELYIELMDVRGIGIVLKLLKEQKIPIIDMETVGGKEQDMLLGMFLCIKKGREKNISKIIDDLLQNPEVINIYEV